MKNILIAVLLIILLVFLSGCETPDVFKERETEYEITIMDMNGNIVRQFKKYYCSVNVDDGVVTARNRDFVYDYITGGVVQVNQTGNWHYVEDKNEEYK